MLKRIVRTIAKGLCGLAVLAFFFAPMTNDTGWLIMACSIVVGIPCLLIWKKLEEDDDEETNSRQ
jgi:hypothetical protein